MIHPTTTPPISPMADEVPIPAPICTPFTVNELATPATAIVPNFTCLESQ